MEFKVGTKFKWDKINCECVITANLQRFIMYKYVDDNHEYIMNHTDFIFYIDVGVIQLLKYSPYKKVVDNPLAM